MKWHKGSRAFAPWQSGYAQLATVQDLRDGRALLRFGPGAFGWVDESDLSADTLAVDQTVFCREPGAADVRVGSVTRVSGDSIRLRFDNGELAWRTLDQIEIEALAGRAAIPLVELPPDDPSAGPFRRGDRVWVISHFPRMMLPVVINGFFDGHAWVQIPQSTMDLCVPMVGVFSLRIPPGTRMLASRTGVKLESADLVSVEPDGESFLVCFEDRRQHRVGLNRIAISIATAAHISAEAGSGNFQDFPPIDNRQEGSPFDFADLGRGITQINDHVWTSLRRRQSPAEIWSQLREWGVDQQTREMILPPFLTWHLHRARWRTTRMLLFYTSIRGCALASSVI